MGGVQVEVLEKKGRRLLDWQAERWGMKGVMMKCELVLDGG